MKSHRVFELSFLFRKRWPFFKIRTKTLVEYVDTWPPKPPYPATLDSYRAMEQD